MSYAASETPSGLQFPPRTSIHCPVNPMYKALDKWLVGYWKSLFRRPRHRKGGEIHLFLALCDHYEPLGPADKLGLEYGRNCIARWQKEYPRLFAPFRDADGQPPQHSFFYPEDQYAEELVEAVGALCDRGYGEVEIHLHHRNDTAGTLRDKLVNFRDLLRRQHGLLGSAAPPQPAAMATHPNPEPQSRNPQPAYAFIHGNWAICNSRPDGDWCGVDEEISVLQKTGCYVDMTMPSAPSPTQARMVNSIYYAPASAGRRGHDQGVRAAANLPPSEAASLMFVQGPLGLNFSKRKWGVVPRLENADISGGNEPTHDRLKLWIRQGIHVAGKPEWLFIKLHTHGCLPKNADLLLGETMVGLHRDLADWCRNHGACLHYVTAREMYNVIKAAENGCGTWHRELRDFRICQPPRLKKPLSKV